MQSENDPPTLDYRTPNPAFEGVTIKYFEDGFCIGLPTPPNPVPRVVAHSVGTFVADAAPYAILVLFLFGISRILLIFKHIPWQIFAIIAIILTVGIVNGWTIIRDRRRTPEIKLTTDTLSIRYFFIPSGNLIAIDLARSQIYDVKYVTHSGNLVIRCHHQEMSQFCPSSDPIVLQWIADRIREALKLSSHSTPE